MAGEIARETGRYLVVSVLALSVDYGLLVSLTSLGHVHYLLAACFGFAAGLVVNYSLSVAFVFRQRRLRDRRLEFLGFFVIGILGLGLNAALMALFVGRLGWAVALAKIPATAIGFLKPSVVRCLSSRGSSGPAP